MWMLDVAAEHVVQDSSPLWGLVGLPIQSKMNRLHLVTSPHVNKKLHKEPNAPRNKGDLSLRSSSKHLMYFSPILVFLIKYIKYQRIRPILLGDQTQKL